MYRSHWAIASLGVDLLVDEREVVHGAGVLAVELDDLPVLVDGFLVEALVLVDLAEAHAGLDGRGVEVDRLLVGVHRLVVEALLARSRSCRGSGGRAD